MRVVCILATLLTAQLAAAAVEVRSLRFHVAAETDPATAVLVASHLEETADRLAQAGFPSVRPELPISVLVFADPEQLSRFRGSSTARAFASVSEDRQFIVLAWNAPGNPWLALAHEYAHLVSDDGRMPPWFREGLADYLSLLRGSQESRGLAANAIEGLRTREWLAIPDWIHANDGAPAFRHEMFYAQSWLAVSWLASMPGVSTSSLSPQTLYDKFAVEGAEALALQLRAYAARLTLQEPLEESLPQPRTNLTPSPLADDQWAAWQLELFRGMKGNPAAEPELRDLEMRRPQDPLVQAALGALAIERGRFDEAEERLRIAASDRQATPQTHHRYSLMLLRSSRLASGPRAAAAIRHASIALAAAPDRPEFLRTLAHANVAAGNWSQAAELLLQLQAKPGWEATSAEDFGELLRSRWQRMREVGSPAVAATAPSRTVPAFAAARLAPLRQPHDYGWPPPDTRIFVGRIARVECSASQKLIIMEHPLFHVQFVDPSKQPAKLHHPPLKWTTIPCGTHGWSVNIAYVPYHGRGRLTGEVRAILF